MKERDRVAQERTGTIIRKELYSLLDTPTLTVHGNVKERFEQVKIWLIKIGAYSVKIA